LGKEELDIEVLENRSTGIFGIVGNRRAKVRATPKKDPYMEPAREILAKILSLLSLDTRVTAGKKGDHILLNIEGNNTGLLIGHKGKTLEVLEFIVNKAVNKISQKRVRVIVDTENYRQKREDYLRGLAFKMSEKAKKTKKTVTINPISPHDRRIVHLALKEDRHVQTQSNGEGLFKKVHIIPHKRKLDEKER
jgi:spoIIIJ-associated protein